MHDIPLDALIRVDGVLYEQEVHNNDIQEGDLVLDLGDFSYGYCDMVIGDSIAVRGGFAAEVGVPMSRVRRLKHTVKNISKN